LCKQTISERWSSADVYFKCGQQLQLLLANLSFLKIRAIPTLCGHDDNARILPHNSLIANHYAHDPTSHETYPYLK
jgi:hypothetical protein